jgi:hypothetical protein
MDQQEKQKEPYELAAERVLDEEPGHVIALNAREHYQQLAREAAGQK